MQLEKKYVPVFLLIVSSWIIAKSIVFPILINEKCDIITVTLRILMCMSQALPLVRANIADPLRFQIEHSFEN